MSCRHRKSSLHSLKYCFHCLVLFDKCSRWSPIPEWTLQHTNTVARLFWYCHLFWLVSGSYSYITKYIVDWFHLHPFHSKMFSRMLWKNCLLCTVNSNRRYVVCVDVSTKQTSWDFKGAYKSTVSDLRWSPVFNRLRSPIFDGLCSPISNDCRLYIYRFQYKF